MPFYISKTEVVQYVASQLQLLERGSRLITTIIPVKSVGYSVLCVTNTWSAGSAKRRRNCYKRRTTISTKNTQDG